jgi:hypothetical protein
MVSGFHLRFYAFKGSSPIGGWYNIKIIMSMKQKTYESSKDVIAHS